MAIGIEGVSVFEVLEHTADIGLRASAKSKAGMFEEAALAVVSIAMEIEDIDPRHVYAIAATGDDLESLLVNWLSEILYYIDGERVGLRHFHGNTLDDHSVTAQAWGEPLDPARHRPRLVVKGVTWHQLSIRHENSLWTCEVFLDI